MCCGLFGIAAWTMGAADLNEMRRGQMDRTGQGLTQAGMILGIIATVLMVIYVAFYVIALAFSA
jgi:hypothetical protein